MSQEYQNISVTEKVYDSLPKLLERDDTGVTASAGTAFPQELDSKMLGRVCLRTDQKILYYLSKLDPVTWTLMIDFSQPLATLDEVETNYQPLNSNLTALSNLSITANTIPYFNSATSMSTLTVTDFTRSLFQVNNASGARSLLGLGNLATVNSISSSNVDSYIGNSSLPVSKFNFTPIKSGEGYTVGDVKESYNSANETGWLLLNKGYTIGDSSSGATYRGNDYQALYLKIWGLANVSYYNSDGSASSQGSSASNCWNAHRRMSLPSGTNYLNSNCTFKIRYL